MCNRQLIELKNIGEKIAGRLHEVGIFTEKDLRCLGPVAAYKLIQENYPEETLPVCYYLFSFEGALQDISWDAIGAEQKLALKRKIIKKQD